MFCPKHKRYRGKRRPKCACAPCWFLYLSEHPETDLKDKDLRLMFLSLLHENIKAKADIKELRLDVARAQGCWV